MGSIPLGSTRNALFILEKGVFALIGNKLKFDNAKVLDSFETTVDEPQTTIL